MLYVFGQKTLVLSFGEKLRNEIQPLQGPHHIGALFLASVKCIIVENAVLGIPLVGIFFGQTVATAVPELHSPIYEVVVQFLHRYAHPTRDFTCGEAFVGRQVFYRDGLLHNLLRGADDLRFGKRLSRARVLSRYIAAGFADLGQHLRSDPTFEGFRGREL